MTNLLELSKTTNPNSFNVKDGVRSECYVKVVVCFKDATGYSKVITIGRNSHGEGGHVESNSWKSEFEKKFNCGTNNYKVYKTNKDFEKRIKAVQKLADSKEVVIKAI